MHTVTERKLLMLKPSQIVSSKNHCRKSFDEYDLQKLADSISAGGVIQPLLIRKNSDGDYELISGERRLRAAKMAGLRRVPCVFERVGDVTAALYSIIDNMQRKNLNFFEEAEEIKLLMSRYGLTRTETAIRLGISQQTLTEKICVLRLPQNIRERITEAGLTGEYARQLLRIPNERQSDVLSLIITGGLTVKQTEQLIEEILNPPKPQEIEEVSPIRKMAIGDVRIFANSFYKLVETIQNAGIEARTQKNENERYVEFKVRIAKESLQTGCQQLKIC